jgi:hypothetical protein
MTTGAVLVCGDSARLLVESLVRVANAELGIATKEDSGPKIVPLNPNELPLIGFEWKCPNYESFLSIRQSVHIKTYGADFRKALLKVSSQNVIPELRQVMREAMEKRDLAKRVKGVFATVGTISGVVDSISSASGVDHGISTVSKLIGLSSYLVEKNRGRGATKNEWFTIGPKITQIGLEQSLKKDR